MTLSKEQKEKFINEHLPYKLSRLIAIHVVEEMGLERNDNKGYKNLVNRIAIEDGFTTGRLFLNFMGIKLSKQDKLTEFKPSWSDDVLINNLGGTKFNPTEIDELSVANKKTLTIFLKRANKGSAHFTMERPGEPDGFEELKPGINLILEFLHNNLFRPLNIPFELKFEGLLIDLDQKLEIWKEQYPSKT